MPAKTGKMHVKANAWGKPELVTRSLAVLEQYSGTAVTVRQLYYRLVAQGYENSLKAYKRVVAVTGDARWEGSMDFDAFEDRDRRMTCTTDWEDTDLDSVVENAVEQVEAWMSSYRLNRWSNQPLYVEVWIEKKALEGVFSLPCQLARVGLFPCKGYPSLTSLYEAAQRFQKATDAGKSCVILYWGDYDCSGEDIPRNIAESLERLGAEVEVRRCALTEEMVREMGLPAAPTKQTDSRAAAWDGHGQVELDAVDPAILKKMVKDAIAGVFDNDKYAELEKREDEERKKFQVRMKEAVLEMDFSTDDSDDDSQGA